MRKILVLAIVFIIGFSSCKMFSAMETMIDFTTTSAEYIYDEVTED